MVGNPGALLLVEFYGENDTRDLAKHTGRILKDELGPNVAVFDMDGFDTHAGQLYNNNKNLEEFDNLLITLENSLGDAWKNTLIITYFSEIIFCIFYTNIK